MENQSHVKNSKIIKITLLILIFIILFLIIQSTYSKYFETNDKPAKFNISGWNILINGINISESKTFSEKLKLEFQENDNVSDNVVVPSSIGSFEITIDSTGTTVPFKYEVSIEDLDISSSSIEDFKIISYEIDDKVTELTPDKQVATGTILPPSNISDTSKHTIKFNVQWYDVDSNTENYNNLENEKDKLDNFKDADKASKSATSEDLKNVLIPVKVTVTQIINNTKNSNSITE